MKTTKTALYILSLSVLLTVPAFGLSRAEENPWKNMGVIKPRVVKAVDNFALFNIKDERVTISDFKNKVVFLNFWATWCGPCREEMPAMERLYNKYKKRGFVILGINHMEGKDKAKRFMEEMSLTFPTLLDVKGEVTRLFNVYALPSSFFIDKKGRVRGVAYGAREWDGDGAVKIIEQLLGEV